MNSRRQFLKGLGAASGAIAAGAVAAPEEVKRKIVKDVVVRRAVYEDVLVTSGDGSKDGDTAMIKIDGHYRSCFRKNGKWSMMFQT